MGSRELLAALVGAALVGAAGLVGLATADESRTVAPEARAALAGQWRSLDSTEGLLVAQIEARETRLRTRLRAAYKALQGHAPAPLWAVDERGPDRARLRAAIRRVVTREAAELQQVREELAQVERARVRVAAARSRAAGLDVPGPGSLHNPVAFSRVLEGFGRYRHGPSKTRLSRRGVVLSSRAGRNIRAVADGRVEYRGSVRGLGVAALVRHAGFWSLSGPLAEGPARVEDGATVERGAVLGESAEDAVYLEIRLATGGAGVPVDPVPLMAR